MRKAHVTYGQLDAALQSLGFSVRVEAGKHRLYTHAKTGAVFSLPDRRRTELVSATHFAAAQHVVAAYDIADEVEFASQLQKAS
jgi:hypothetical protein